LGDQIKKNEVGGACNTHWDKQRCIQDLVGRPEGSPLGRPRHTWWDDIKVDLQEVESGASTRLIWFTIGTGQRVL